MFARLNSVENYSVCAWHVFAFNIIFQMVLIPVLSLSFPFVNSMVPWAEMEQQQADPLVAFVIHRPLAPSCSGIWRF